MSKQLISLLQCDLRPRILVVGDVMLDRYSWGSVRRISPEAPIPVLQLDRQEHRLGGAGSAASMLAALGAHTVLAAIVGDDQEGRLVRRLLEEIEVDGGPVVTAPGCTTTVKERLLGRSHQHDLQHMVRVDRENSGSITAELRDRLLSNLRGCFDGFDLVLVSDYDKGVCRGDMIHQLAQPARLAGLPVLADPVRDADYHRYAGCTCITPNRLEASLALAMEIATAEDGLEAARRMVALGFEAVLVTLDRDGIAWADSNGHARLFPSRPRQICDITGAGDTVISTVGYCLAVGADYPTAIQMANLAAGIEVERLGIVPVSRADLLAELSHATGDVKYKILSAGEMESQLVRERQAGKRIVMTNGCFDLLHPGHVALLQEARKRGDCLVVGLNGDRSVRKLKGEGRPIIGQQGRAETLAAMACVDYVVIFDETSVAGLVGRLLPDILVKASDYSIQQVVGREIVESHGGRVELVAVEPGYSTSGLISKLRCIEGGSASSPLKK